VDVLVLRTPDLLTTFVNNCIQVWVSVSNLDTGRLGEEVWEKGVVDEVGFIIGGRRLYGGGGDRGQVAERWGWAPNDVFGRQGAGWEDGRDGWQDILGFFDEQDVLDEAVEKGSVGGDVGEEVQRFVLKVVELVASDGEEGVEEDTSRWGGDVVVEERRRRGECVLTGVEHVLDGGGGGVEVGLVGETYFRPGRGGDGGGDGGVGVIRVVESKFGPTGGDVDRGGGGGDRDVEDVFVELHNKVGRRGDGTKGEGHLVC